MSKVRSPYTHARAPRSLTLDSLPYVWITSHVRSRITRRLLHGSSADLRFVWGLTRLVVNRFV